MKLLDINDSGVGDEIANIQLDRSELEWLYMCVSEELESRACSTPTKEGEETRASLTYIQDMLDMILSLWENSGDDDEPIGVTCE